jgi:NADPH-dependent curcumin reductase CurA
MTNRQWVLASHPKGAADENTWKLTEAPPPRPGQILIKTQWLSVDSYMRGRISPSANYTRGCKSAKSCRAARRRSGGEQPSRLAEDVLNGFERVPESFMRVMAGRNFGKQLVRL